MAVVPPKILICEDNAEARECVGRLLQISLNAKIEQCESGNKAKEILTRDKFDVVISDYDMGPNKGTGLDVYQHIQDFGLDCRFYLFTATLTDFSSFKSNSNFKFVSKPDLPGLVEEIKQFFYGP